MSSRRAILRHARPDPKTLAFTRQHDHVNPEVDYLFAVCGYFAGWKRRGRRDAARWAPSALGAISGINPRRLAV